MLRTTFALLFTSLTAGTSAMVLRDTGSVLARDGTTNNTCQTVDAVQFTFFGWPDNSPPGAGKAYTCPGRGPSSGGTGTHDDPVTIATAIGELNKCDTIYIPYLKKYGIFEGYCQQCIDDWNGHKYHIDIWTGSSQEGGDQDQTGCEWKFTPATAQTIVRNPPPGLEVNTGSLYDKNTQPTCHKDTQTFTNYDAGSYCH
ncbi:MAG: hypothetical protein Q9165_003792 [Trypethelium subeluteriae]